MTSLIPHYHAGKPSSKRFQLRFSTHHKELQKRKKFEKKVTTDCYDLDESLADTKNCLSDTTDVISKLNEMKFRKSPGNINYSYYWYCKTLFVGANKNDPEHLSAIEVDVIYDQTLKDMSDKKRKP